MEIIRLEDLSVDQLASRIVRATDGVISVVVWENPFNASATAEILLPVKALTREHIAPVQRRLRELLGIRDASWFESLSEPDQAE